MTTPEASPTYERIRFETEGSTAVLTLDDPATRNALGPAMREEVADAVQRVRRDRSVRALVITGAGGHFCSGGDLRSIASAGLDNQGWRERLHDLHGWLRDLITLDRPVVAAVDGAAFGAGFGLAMAADFVIATPRARLCVSFIKIGLVPDCGTFYTLPRIVGAQRAKELMLSGREVGGEEALRLGLAMELHAPEQLLPRARALADSFAGASPSAASLIKRSLAAADDLDTRLELEASAQALAMGTAGHRDAVADFLAKRAPRFQWPG